MCTAKPGSKIVNEITNRSNRASADRYLIEAIERNDNKSEATVVIDVGNGQVRMKLDTGAEVCVLPVRVHKALSSRDSSLTEMLKVQPTDTQLVAYGGADIPVLGTCEIECRHDKTTELIKFFVVESEGRTVLSLKACQALNLIKILCSIEKTSTMEPENNIANEQQKVDNIKPQESKTKQSMKKKNTLDEKVSKIKDLEGEQLKTKLLEMYPKVFSGLGRLEPPCKRFSKKSYPYRKSTIKLQ